MLLEQKLLDRIHPDVSPLWAVSDIDGLFRNDAVSRLLSERQAEVILYEDSMAFRYRYEHEIRPRLESTEPGCHVIVFEPGPDAFHSLPADIYGACQRIEVAIGDYFPHLSRSVLKELDPALLSCLWEKRDQFPGSAIGDRETADLVLRQVFRLEPSFITSFQDLVHALIPLHFGGQRLPEKLANRIEEAAAASGDVLRPDVRRIVREPAAFWEFLQAEWERWLIPKAEKSLQEIILPSVSFDDDRVRVWVDNLFLEGFLEPIPGGRVTAPLPRPWCRIGVASAEARPVTEEINRQREHLLGMLPDDDADYRQWFRFAQAYSTHVAALFSNPQPPELIDVFWKELWSAVDVRFLSFARNRMESLANLPPTRPVMVHHISQFLDRRVKEHRKVALLVLDGLSLSQWKVVRRSLEKQRPNLLFEEGACFTMVPSITNVCRQTIYAGELPAFFAPTLHRTDVDEKRWRAFWDSTRGRSFRCAFGNILGQDNDLDTIDDILGSGVQALGLTIRMPDEIVHGATMGWRGIHGQLKLWSSTAFFPGLLDTLLVRGYSIFLTSDHGNIEAVGTGIHSQGALVDRRGERVRIYSEETIYTQSAAELSSRASAWTGNLLPQGYRPLLHQGRGAFVQNGKTLVCHGGASLDELVVPFIEISASKSP